MGLSTMLISCDGNGGLDKINDFDQQPFLKNIGENIILPAYASLAIENERLAEAINALADDPTEATLLAAQTQLKAARLAWQQCTPFQFGPAETHGLSADLNIYPIDQFQLELNINSGDYDLSTVNNADVKGYQTIGFLIHGDPDTDEDVLGTLSPERLQYLVDVVARIDMASQAVFNAWKPEGENYLATFTAEDALGVDIGSSVGKLVNAMNRDFERHTRDGKIGIPVGIRSSGTAIPKACEAYFGGYSVELLEANMAAYYQLYLGGSNGIGFDDYLNEIGASTTGNEDLAETIEKQFDRINTTIDAIGDPLPEAITSSKTEVEMVFAEMQILVVLFKTDMASSIGVIISYQDNDGD